MQHAWVIPSRDYMASRPTSRLGGAGRLAVGPASCLAVSDPSQTPSDQSQNTVKFATKTFL